jgi:hypothetical protein
MVALTGIERANGQFSSVPLGLSRYVFNPAQFATSAFKALRVAGVRTWCALEGQSSLAFTESRKCVAGGQLALPGGSRVSTGLLHFTGAGSQLTLLPVAQTRPQADKRRGKLTRHLGREPLARLARRHCDRDSQEAYVAVRHFGNGRCPRHLLWRFEEQAAHGCCLLATAPFLSHALIVIGWN